MIKTDNNLTEAFGFHVQDCSQPGARGFWATIVGTSDVPYTIKADRIDLEDFAMSLDVCAHYPTIPAFLKAMCLDSWERFVYMFVDHLQSQGNSKVMYMAKLTIMGKIFSVIEQDASVPVTEHYTHSGFKVAGHTLDIYARRVPARYNYSNDFGDYRVWIESPGITDLESLLVIYSDIIMNYTLRRSPN